MDSHADMCCVGNNTHILHTWPNKNVRVTPFLRNLGVVESAPIVSALIAYDDPSSGAPILLAINQAVYFDTLEHNLLCLMQLWHHGIIVNDRPKHVTRKPTVDDHCIHCPEDANLKIPLELYGVTSYFPSRKPSNEEVALFEQEGGTHLTSNHPEWDPKSDFFAELENMMMDTDGNVHGSDKTRINLFSGPPSILALQTLDNLVYPFRSLRIPDEIHMSAVMTHVKREHYADQLAEAWSMSPSMARRTIRATTQQGIRTWGTVNTERRNPSGDRPLHYPLIVQCQYIGTK